MKKNMVGKGWFFGLRMMLMIVAVFCFIWFALPLTLSVSLNIGNLTGLAVSVLLFFYGLLMPWVHRIMHKWRIHKGLRFFALGNSKRNCIGCPVGSNRIRLYDCGGK